MISANYEVSGHAGVIVVWVRLPLQAGVPARRPGRTMNADSRQKTVK
jgi:hypothetical protein